MKIALLLVFLFAPPLSAQSAPRPAQIILIRHAEKPADPADPHLSPEGVQRAQRLVAFLSKDPQIVKFGAPAAIIATATTKHDDGQRTQETVAPLARALGLSVQAPYLGKQYFVIAKRILKDRSLAGKTVVICWNHEWLPELAAALGVSPQPSKWKGGNFDGVYLITYPGGRATLTETTERLSAK